VSAQKETAFESSSSEKCRADTYVNTGAKAQLSAFMLQTDRNI